MLRKEKKTFTHLEIEVEKRFQKENNVFFVFISYLQTKLIQTKCIQRAQSHIKSTTKYVLISLTSEISSMFQLSVSIHLCVFGCVCILKINLIQRSLIFTNYAKFPDRLSKK